MKSIAQKLGDDIIRTSTHLNASYSTGVITALLVNHWVGLSLESLILQIRSHVNDRNLWGKLLLSMISYIYHQWLGFVWT